MDLSISNQSSGIMRLTVSNQRESQHEFGRSEEAGFETSFAAASDSSLSVSRTLHHPPFNPSPPSPRVLKLQRHAGSALAESLTRGSAAEWT